MVAQSGGQDKKDTGPQCPGTQGRGFTPGAGQAWKAGLGEASGQRERAGAPRRPGHRPPLPGGERVAPMPAPATQCRRAVGWAWLSGEASRPALLPGHPRANACGASRSRTICRVPPPPLHRQCLPSDRLTLTPAPISHHAFHEHLLSAY